MKRFLIFFTLFLGMFPGFSFAAHQEVSKTGTKPTLVPDEIIVKFDRSVTDAGMDKIENGYGLHKKKESYRKGEFVVYKHNSPGAILNRLKNEPGVIYAEQNAYAYACMIPNAPYYPCRQHMQRIGMEDARDIPIGTGAVAAIIDTGVCLHPEDLVRTNFTAGWDFANDDNDPCDDHGHGSHLCVTVARSINNVIEVTGIAYNYNVMPIKVLDNNGSGTYDNVADGIMFATDNGAHVINLSLGGLATNSALLDAVDYAWDNGVVVVCAAEGFSSNEPYYPAAYTNAIAVGGTNYPEEKADCSIYGPYIEIRAPGGDTNDYNRDGYMDRILQDICVANDPEYYFYIDTSSACACVTGTAAMLKACHSTLTNTEIRNILTGTALDLGTPGWDPYHGYGWVDARAAAQVACTLQPCFFVQDIVLSIIVRGRRYYAIATITIMDSNGFPVPNATVYVTWSGVVSAADSGVTGADGTVTFKSPYSKYQGPFYFTVDYVYHPTMPPCPYLMNSCSHSSGTGL